MIQILKNGYLCSPDYTGGHIVFALSVGLFVGLFVSVKLLH